MWSLRTPSIKRGKVALAAFSLFLLPGIATAQSRALGAIRVTTLDESENPVAAVVVELKLKGAVVHTAGTNEKGEAEFANVAVRTYEVAVSKETFEPLNQGDVTVTGGASMEIRFTMVPRISLIDAVNVQAGSTTAIEQASSPSTELQRGELKNLPSKPATVADTLPLVPGVVRSSEGEIKISGSGEHRSALVVNSADVTDPATGQFGMTVPVDSVETINVFKTPLPGSVRALHRGSGFGRDTARRRQVALRVERSAARVPHSKRASSGHTRGFTASGLQRRAYQR